MIEMTNAKAFQDMLKRRVAVETRKTNAEIVNKCALQVLIGSGTGAGAVNTTEKASRAQIRKDLNTKYHSWSFRGKSQSVKLIFLLASKALVRQGFKFRNLANWNANVAVMAQRIYKARDQSRAFLAAGWLQAALDLGKRVRMSVRGKERKLLRPTGRASMGRAVPATESNLMAICYNNSVDGGIKRGHFTGSGKAFEIVMRGLNESLANQTRDLELYVVRKETEKKLKALSDA